MNQAAAAGHLVVVDDDPLFRESLIENLREDGYAVTDFEAAQPVLTHLSEGGAGHHEAGADLIVLDWHMPGMNGIQLLRALRERGVMTPVLFLTVLGDQIYEEAALSQGAVDFVEKSRSVGILKRRIALSLARGQSPARHADTAADTGGEAMPMSLNVGALTVNPNTARAHWRGQEVPLTLNEYRLVDLLARRAGKDVGYRELYDCIHGAGFIAGPGDEGYRGNVRTLIKRIRHKFRDLDSGFDAIETYPGFGYRWRADTR